MIELGKYAGTVLQAYGVSLVLLLGIVVQTIRANARARAALQEHENRG
ncbi:heme exporter protein CcmD [Paracoccus laeviglucosivorans]|uniref:Heme exporter protein D n=1 Tax=Paracoccus laeviglucosivorans TaxID=1197861 RepID=A0A521BXQ5_9RHOB|nr:heme exporter protein CcmD [Paracoccus laeviglucosivorans]SMO51973.1 heme exporter protein D [Paracoccus laeviglucosivorans]